jgi:hypothetical protein
MKWPVPMAPIAASGRRRQEFIIWARKVTLEAIGAVPATERAEAEAKLAALNVEAAKGRDVEDGVVAKLVVELVGLLPRAAEAVVSAFGGQALGEITGPETSIVPDKLKGDGLRGSWFPMSPVSGAPFTRALW